MGILWHATVHLSVSRIYPACGKGHLSLVDMIETATDYKKFRRAIVRTISRAALMQEKNGPV